MSDGPDRPTRRLLRGLRALLPPDSADDIVRDLEVSHARRAREAGRLRAGLWLLVQAVQFGARFSFERARDFVKRRRRAGALGQDLGLAARSMRREPVFHAAVVLTLAIAIGANTAIFSIVDAVLLAPLPYPEQDRLIALDPYPWTHAGIVLDVEASSPAVEAVTALYPGRFAMTGDGRPEEIEGAEVTPGFFAFLGARPVAGRTFDARDAAAGAARTVVLGHGLWQRRWGGDPSVVGRVVTIDGTPHEVIGVMEPGFRVIAPRSEDPQLWLPLRLEVYDGAGEPNWAIPLARLRSGAERAQASAELAAVVERYLDAAGDDAGLPRGRPHWEPLGALLTGEARPGLLVLQGAVVLVLLLACVNVANLLLVRFGARRTEVAVRTALGASHGRIVRQFLTESMLLAVVGGLTGMALLYVLLDPVLRLVPRDVPRIADVALDVPSLLFTLATCVATGLLFGAVPAVAAARQAPHRLLKEGGRTATASRARRRLTQALVVAQVMLTLMLLAGAGLLVRSFVTLTDRAFGFGTEGILAVEMHVPPTRHADVQALDAFYDRALRELRDVPGVASVALANNLPMQRASASRLIVVEGETDAHTVQYGVVSTDYFEALGIPLERGRSFAAPDRRGSLPVAVIDRSMARAVWPGEDAVGRRFRFEGSDTWLTVVGVVADTRGGGLASEPDPGFYIPHLQRPDDAVELAVGRNAVFLLRPDIPARDDLGAAIRRAIWAVDPEQPVPGIASLAGIVSAGVSPERFRATLLAVFAGLAVILAVAGIYGVVSHLLAERTHEFGIRRALGATDVDVVGRVLRFGLGLAAVGTVLGLGGILVGARFLSALLFGIQPYDPATLAGAIGVVLVVTVVACMVPAWRAARTDAIVALRSE